MSHSEPLVIKPTFVSVDQELLRRLHVVCESALENASDCLAAHESSLGRTTRKNIRLAGFYEQDIQQAKQALAEVRSALGWPLKAKPDEETHIEPPTAEHWTDGFEGFLKEQLDLAEMAHRSNPCGPTSVRPRTLKMVMDSFQFHKGRAKPDAHAESLVAFEEWLTQECEKNNRLLAIRYSDEADLRRDEELVHTITTLRRYKQQTTTDS